MGTGTFYTCRDPLHLTAGILYTLLLEFFTTVKDPLHFLEPPPVKILLHLSGSFTPIRS